MGQEDRENIWVTFYNGSIHTKQEAKTGWRAPNEGISNNQTQSTSAPGERGWTRPESKGCKICPLKQVDAASPHTFDLSVSFQRISHPLASTDGLHLSSLSFPGGKHRPSLEEGKFEVATYPEPVTGLGTASPPEQETLFWGFPALPAQHPGAVPCTRPGAPG